jgi:hypothetical protein
MDLYKSEMGAEAERERNRTGGERSDTMEDKQMSFDDGGVKNEIESRKESAPIGKNINKEINQAVKTKAAKEHGK